MSKKLYIFSAEWCVNCPPLKNYLNNIGIEYEDVDIESEEGAKLAAQYTVRSLPTSLITGAEGETLLLEAGTGAIDRIRKEMGK